MEDRTINAGCRGRWDGAAGCGFPAMGGTPKVLLVGPVSLASTRERDGSDATLRLRIPTDPAARSDRIRSAAAQAVNLEQMDDARRCPQTVLARLSGGMVPHLKTQPDRLLSCMVTIHRAHGLRVIIFTDDHEPAHVHVFGDGQARINLIGSDGAPTVVWAEGMKANDLRRAMRLVRDQQEQFLARWREIHG